MYHFWEAIIGPALSACNAKSIVEIGVGSGRNTKNLLVYCKENSAKLQAVDVSPSCDIALLSQGNESRFMFFQDLSLSVLPILKPFDAVLIDGDHNWYTVYHELKSIEDRSKRDGSFPLVFLHDTGWPYARRDLYYNPETIPPHSRQAYRKGGLDQGSLQLTNEGGLNSEFFHAIYQNNAKNGVLTAVEDFLKETHLTLHVTYLPGFHGLCIIAPSALLKERPTLSALLTLATIKEPLKSVMHALEADRVASTVALGQVPSLWTEIHNLQKEKEDRKTELERTRTVLWEEQSAKSNLESQLSQEKIFHQKIRDEQSEERKRFETYLTEKRTAWEKREQEQESERAQLQTQIANLQAALDRHERTLSWRITAPLRLAPSTLKQMLKARGAIRILGRMWKAIGEPLPGLARFIRHRLLPKALPSQFEPSLPGKTVTPPPQIVLPLPTKKTNAHVFATPIVAVVIHVTRETLPFLKEAIESALAQTLPPSEILVLDSTLQEHALLLVEAYKDREVKILQGNWRKRADAFNAGVEMTTAPLIHFVEAKDLLHIDTLKIALEKLKEFPDAAILYADQQLFGSMQTRLGTPTTFDWSGFSLAHYDPCAAIFRRTALLKAGGWSEKDDDRLWVTWRTILKQGGKAIHFRGLTFCRTGSSLGFSGALTKTTFAQKQGYFDEPTTLCLSLSGRKWAWHMNRTFLENQTFPHSLIHLIILDTSQDEEFGKMIETWLQQCDYAKVTYRKEVVGPKGLADEPRELVRDPVCDACVKIYNRFRELADTKIVLFLEDDVLPPYEVYRRLIGHFDEGVLSVSAAIRHRSNLWGGNHPTIACNWGANGLPVFAEEQQGVAEIGGNGFSCAVVNGDFFRKTVIHDGPPPFCFDHNFYRALRDARGRALLDWNCTCKHYSNEYTWI